MHEGFARLLATRLPSIRQQFPGEGRRKWHLRIIQEFWQNTTHSRESDVTMAENVASEDNNPNHQDEDPLDYVTEGPELGILLRTDFSNEEAWQALLAKLEIAEKELLDDLTDDQVGAETPNTVPNPPDDASPEGDDSDSSTESGNATVIYILNLLADRTEFDGISNVRALQMLNDVDIRPSPPIQPGGSKATQHPLVDLAGLQEIYTGKNIWIYDALSNDDGSVRQVRQTGDFYGTATGDSWRARISHICEIQYNMSCLGMKVNFGGLDRWDYNERQRNIEERLTMVHT